MKSLFLGAIFFYILLLWAIGWVASKRSKGSESYLVADRRFSTSFVSALIAGTWIGGVSVVGMAQGAFLHGISAISFQLGIWVAMCFTAAFLPKIILGKKTYSILDVVTRYYDHRTANLAGLFQLVFSIWVVTMQIVGGGAILSFILKDTITFAQGMLLTALVFCFYVLLGGVIATAYTNLVHLVAIFLGIMAGGIYLLTEAGGIAAMKDSLPAFYFEPLGDLGLFTVLSWFFVNLTLGVLAQPVINAAVSAKDLHHGRLGILIGNLLAIPVPLLAALCGILARVRYPEVASVRALPALLNDLPPFLAFLFLLGMWAPLMSSGSPFLMGAATIAIRGYVVKWFPHLKDKGLLMASRIATLSITGIALLLGFFVVEILRNVTEIAVLLSSVVILVLLGGLFKNSSKLGGFLSLLISMALLALFIATGWAKRIHPFWVVTPATVIIIGFFTWIEGRKKKRSSPP
jgi:SSS family solute:Na+ symporter